MVPRIAFAALALSAAQAFAQQACPLHQGDSVDAVKRYFNVDSPPQPMKTVTPGGSAYQYHFADRVVWVFFDENQRLTVLRFERPYSGKIGGIAVGDSREQVRRALGEPHRTIEGPKGPDPSRRTTGWVYKPGAPDFVRYDIVADDVVKAIFSGRCS